MITLFSSPSALKITSHVNENGIPISLDEFNELSNPKEIPKNKIDKDIISPDGQRKLLSGKFTVSESFSVQSNLFASNREHKNVHFVCCEVIENDAITGHVFYPLKPSDTYSKSGAILREVGKRKYRGIGPVYTLTDVSLPESQSARSPMAEKLKAKTRNFVTTTLGVAAGLGLMAGGLRVMDKTIGKTNDVMALSGHSPDDLGNNGITVRINNLTVPENMTLGEFAKKHNIPGKLLEMFGQINIDGLENSPEPLKIVITAGSEILVPSFTPIPSGLALPPPPVISSGQPLPPPPVLSYTPTKNSRQTVSPPDLEVPTKITTYTSVKGDTYYRIFTKHNINEAEFLNLNPGTDINKILQIGIVFNVPEVSEVKSEKYPGSREFAPGFKDDLAAGIMDDDIRKYIKKGFPKEKIITGDMILKSSELYGVDPFLIAAVLKNDSSYGTAGKGSRNNNPGNVGQTDEKDAQGITVEGYETLQEGVNEVAKNLKKRIGSYQQVCGTNRTPTEHEIIVGVVESGKMKGTKFWGRYMTKPTGPENVENMRDSLHTDYVAGILENINKGKMSPSTRYLLKKYVDERVGRCLATVQLTFAALYGDTIPVASDSPRNKKYCSDTGNFARDFALTKGLPNMIDRFIPTNAVIKKITSVNDDERGDALNQLLNALPSLRGEIGIISFTDNKNPWKPGHIAMAFKEGGEWMVLDTDIGEFNRQGRKIIPIEKYVGYVAKAAYHLQSFATLENPSGVHGKQPTLARN